MKLTNIMSSLLAGSLVLGSAFVDAQPRPAPAPAPAPAPRPPRPPKVHVQIDGLEGMIEQHIQFALDAIGSQGSNLPPEVRAKIVKRLEKVRAKVKAKVAAGKLDADALEELGEELGAEMEQFGEEMEEWGEKMGKDMEKKMGKLQGQLGQIGPRGPVGPQGNIDIDVDFDDDDDDDIAGIDVDDDDDDIADAVRDMGQLHLKQPQRDQIRKLRADSDAKVASAKRELDRASEQLKKQLDNPAASDADIARAVDAVAQQEAAIRKARILAWHNARRVLDDAQRAKVQGAVKRKSK